MHKCLLNFETTLSKKAYFRFCVDYKSGVAFSWSAVFENKLQSACCEMLGKWQNYLFVNLFVCIVIFSAFSRFTSVRQTSAI